MMTRVKIFCFLWLSSGSSLAQLIAGSGCPDLSKAATERIENYLAHRLVSGTAARPSVTSVSTLPDTCYRKLTISIPGATRDIVMYLSPDERFLTSTVYDLSADPQEEVARIAENVKSLLLRDPSPQFQGSNPRVILVEFVDFQCPYCKRFADWYWNLPQSLRDQTTLIFKNLPLAQHAWARSAALYAVCTNIQSPVAFRKLSDFLFQTQSEITPEMLKAKVSSLLSQSHTVNLQQLEACASGVEGLQIVDRDIDVATQLNVKETPTLFINGRRVLRVSSADEMQRLLESEMANANSRERRADEVSAQR